VGYHWDWHRNVPEGIKGSGDGGAFQTSYSGDELPTEHLGEEGAIPIGVVIPPAITPLPEGQRVGCGVVEVLIRRLLGHQVELFV